MFDVGENALWERLQRRNTGATPSAHPITRVELARVLSICVPPTADELMAVDMVTVHTDPCP